MRERSQFVPKDIEAVCDEIVKPKCKPMLVTSIYRPPNSKADFMDQLENYFNILDEQNKELIMTGDLNCDLSLSVLQPHSCRLVDILELFQLKQLIVDPTRITSNTESLLNIMATNRPDKVQDSGVIQIGISDHSLVYLCLKISIPRDKPKIVESINLKNYNNNCFNHHLYYLLSNSIGDLKDLNKLWDQLINIFNSVSDNYARLKTRKVRSTYAPWLTTYIRCEMNKRDYLRKKEMWKNINQIIGGKGRCSKTTTITTLKDDQGNIIHDEKLIANQLNKYFVEIGPKLSISYLTIVEYFLNIRSQ